MKIVFLNTWHNKMEQELGQFLAEQVVDGTDIFCLQEADNAVRASAQKMCAGYQEFVHAKTVSATDNFQLVTYVRNNISVQASGTVLEQVEGVGLCLYVKLLLNGSTLYVCNVHGQSQPGNKLDSVERLCQSKSIIDFFADRAGAKLIGGDFNLLPPTRSVQMFAQNGYENLIEDFHIATTRNELAWDRFPADQKQNYADYVFASSELEITNFTVPYSIASDHLSLIAEFNVQVAAE